MTFRAIIHRLTVTLSSICNFRLAMLLMISGGVLSFRYLIATPDQARFIVRYGGYYLIAACFITFVIIVGRAVRARWDFNSLYRMGQRHWPALFVVLFVSLQMHLHEPHRFKVLHDEFALLGNSQMMHLYREGSVPANAHYFNGQVNHTGRYVGKRSQFFQFLVSVLHDFTGYRPANAFILNGIVTILFFGSVYGSVYLFLGDRKLAIIGVLMAAVLPLVPHVATSGGYDLLNVTMIFFLFACLQVYLRSPTLLNQSLLVYAGVLAAQTRYESILYLLVIAVVVLMVWIRERSVKVSWVAVVSPIFLLVPLMLNLNMYSSPILMDSGIRGEGQAFMALHYLPNNLSLAISYFFTPDHYSTNSVLISICGSVGFIFAFVVWIARSLRGQRIVAGLGVYVLICSFVFICFFIMSSHYWGQLTDYQATRFALPIYLFGIPGFLLLLSESVRSSRVTTVFACVIASYGLIFSVSSASRSYVTRSMVPSLHANYFLDFANKTDSSSDLFLSDGVIGLIAHDHAAYPVQDINKVPEAVLRMAGYKLYRNFYALEMYELDSSSSEYLPQGRGRSLHSSFVTERVDEKVFMPNYLSRIVKIVAVRTPSGVVRLDSVGVKYPENLSNNELMKHIFSNFPTSSVFSSATETLYEITD